MNFCPLLVVIAGPTAVGKTKATIQLAQQFHTVVISADSRQFYKEMNIGTAVPTIEERKNIPHYFIQHLSIHDYYNVSRYENDVLSLLSELFTAYKIVLMVGGSGLYIDAVCKGIDDMPDYDPELRQSLIEELQNKGIEWFRAFLQKYDPVTYQQIDLKNKNRVFRAVEVCIQTGKPYSSFLHNKPKKRPFNILKIALNRDRQELYEMINLRVDNMMQQGLLSEAYELYPFKHLVPLKTVGYKELFDHFEGLYNYEQAIELIKRNTRHYARKQLTWLRRDNEYLWFHPNQIVEIIRAIEQQLT
ncbi:MAG: tRNA (adenosine(37)-N6)-dimethylallyltransferase MiaA [Bacteroidales bacterium]|nr:tRNA (adenosine(37)-N6)-dimethylallyltransferase MiaA [Bacteroidales bacterium]